ncbi:hypothetical protein ACJMK2_028462 [Sinanodonta woodiana]|uniref:Protein GDAP2 homolog n=1 Tax=Sinanodonta woodiana TaxID=1069815 RepID=A0ABD3X8Y0_SINWO
MEERANALDPLGARDETVLIETLTRWNMTQLPEQNDKSEAEEIPSSPFPWRNDLNRKIILWQGDITVLNAEAIVHSSNERMTDKYQTTKILFRKAGPKLEEDIRKNIRVCKTGEAKLTEGYGLLARYVIHTVGPRYNTKYITAAEGALFSCYRNVLQHVREQRIQTLGLCCIHSSQRGYPPDQGVHIAIRTIRRFLEKFSNDIETIVFVCEDDTFEVYEKTLPLYFPRSPKEEEEVLPKLPKDIGNDDGEPIIPERQIRIMDKPTLAAYRNDDTDLEETIDLNRTFGSSTVLEVGRHSFSQMEEDPDALKKTILKKRSDSEQRHVELRRRYERLLKRARLEDLTEIAMLRCLYRTGVDRFGRPVVAFVGKNFPANSVDLEKALLYLIRILDPVVEKDYVVVYFHTLTTGENQPPMNFLKTVYSVLDHKYRKNLKTFYIIHPTWWSKLATWFFTTFTASDIKSKVQNLTGVQYLYAKINPDQLDIPPFVLDYDIQVNGPRYYVPFENENQQEGL